MKPILLTLVVLSFLNSLQAQELKPYLSNLIDQKTDSYPSGLNAYANGDYAKAYSQLNISQSLDIPYKREFLAKALLYQRDHHLVKKVLKTDPDLLPENYTFYSTQNPMLLELSDSTSVALDKNLFTAVLQDKDTITIMLDTGGSGIGINKEFVDKYQMPKDTSITSRGYLPAFNVTHLKHPVLIPKLQIGSMLLTNLPAHYSEKDPNSTGTYTGPEFDIIMGLDVFIGYLDHVSFDWESKRLVFKKASDLDTGRPFLFHNSKPFTAYKVKGAYFTTVLDTGAPQDVSLASLYTNYYSQKEEKTYDAYRFTEYTVDFQSANQDSLTLKIGDYLGNLDLKIGGEVVELLIGNRHNRLTFNLARNIFELE